jgi:hypothetical protein
MNSSKKTRFNCKLLFSSQFPGKSVSKPSEIPKSFNKKECNWAACKKVPAVLKKEINFVNNVWESAQTLS